MSGIDQIDEEQAGGWIAIDEALKALYPNQEPQHFGTLLPYELGGPDPLNGISAYWREQPLPHWHYVTYGFSELYDKESEYEETSGYGFELTFRLVAGADTNTPPQWPISFLQNLARYVFKSGNVFDDGHWMTANGPIALESDTQLCSMGFVCDPELPAIQTPNGAVKFLQVVGLTLDEEEAVKRWSAEEVLKVLQGHMPLWVTDLGRASLLEHADVRAQVEAGSLRDGSTSGYIYTDVLKVESVRGALDEPLMEVTMGAKQVEALLVMLPLRLPFDRPVTFAGREWQVRFEPGSEDGVEVQEAVLAVVMRPETVAALAQALHPKEGRYTLPGFEALCINVMKTFIKDADGNVIDVIG